jgi:YVTN family beta-propeller protein
MRRIAAVLALALAALASAGLASLAAGGGSSAQGLTGVRGTLWVANRANHDVSAFDAASGQVLATIGVGREPNSLTLPRGRGKVYVTDEFSDRVSVISTRSFAVLKTIAVGTRPHHVTSSWDGRRVYAALYGTNRVAVIDTATDTLLGEWATNPNTAVRTHMPLSTRDGRVLVTANEIANEIAVLDAATGSRIGGVPIGNRPSEAILTRDGATAYASVRNENRIRRIDVASRTVTGELVVGTQPDTLQLTADGNTLYVALRGTPAQLSVVDLRSFTLVRTIDLAGPGTVAGHNWTTANGRYSFVSIEGTAAAPSGIAVVDHRTHSVVTTYPYPSAGRPHGLQLDEPAALHAAVSVGPNVPVRRGVATVSLICGEATALYCRGSVALVRAGRTLGSARFDLDSGDSARLPVRLRRKAAAARAVVTVRDGLDNLARLSWPVRLRAGR